MDGCAGIPKIKAGKGANGRLVKCPLNFAQGSKYLMISEKYFQIHIFVFFKYSSTSFDNFIWEISEALDRIFDSNLI